LPEDVQIYLPCAIRACAEGVRRAHLISRHTDGALLIELFTHHGIGTMLTPESEEVLRQAEPGDVQGIVQIIEPLEQQGILVRRDRAQMSRDIDNYFVLEAGDNIIGCAALYPFPGDGSAELACLAVNPFYRDGGRGERLLQHAEKLARERKLKALFVLSTQTTHWFIERGFVEVEIAALPEAKRAGYNYDRNSKIYRKGL
jgi:amino-acid N-acetyltransferase